MMSKRKCEESARADCKPPHVPGPETLGDYENEHDMFRRAHYTEIGDLLEYGKMLRDIDRERDYSKSRRGSKRIVRGNFVFMEDNCLLSYSKNPISQVASWFEQDIFSSDIEAYEKYRRVCRSLYLEKEYLKLRYLGDKFDFVDICNAKSSQKFTVRHRHRIIYNEVLDPVFKAMLIGNVAQMFAFPRQVISGAINHVLGPVSKVVGSINKIGDFTANLSNTLNSYSTKFENVADRVTSFIQDNAQYLDLAFDGSMLFMDLCLVLASIYRHGSEGSCEIITMFCLRHLIGGTVDLVRALCKSIRLSFNRSQSMIDDFIPSICSVLSMIGLAIGSMLFKFGNATDFSADKCATFIEKVSEWGHTFFSKTMPTFNKIKEFFSWAIDKVFDHYGLGPLSASGRLNKELDNLILFNEYLKDTRVRAELIGDPARVAEVGEWHAKSVHLNKCLSKEHPRRAEFLVHYSQLETLYNSLLSNQPSPVKQRQRPVGVYVYGRAGGGKTTFVNLLSDALIEIYCDGRPKDKAWRDAHMHKYVYEYRRKLKDTYMNAYTNEHVVIAWAEAFQAQDTAQNPSEDVNFAMSVLDTAGLIVEQAFGTKGKINCLAKFVLATTNRPPPIVTDGLLWQDNEAVNRRFDVFYEVFVNAECADKDGRLDVAKYASSSNPLTIKERRILFHENNGRVSLSIAPENIDPLTGCSLDVRTFEQVLEKVCALQDRYAELFKQLESAEPMNYRNAVSNVKKKAKTKICSNFVPFDPEAFRANRSEYPLMYAGSSQMSDPAIPVVPPIRSVKVGDIIETHLLAMCDGPLTEIPTMANLTAISSSQIVTTIMDLVRSKVGRIHIKFPFNFPFTDVTIATSGPWKDKDWFVRIDYATIRDDGVKIWSKSCAFEFGDGYFGDFEEIRPQAHTQFWLSDITAIQTDSPGFFMSAFDIFFHLYIESVPAIGHGLEVHAHKTETSRAYKLWAWFKKSIPFIVGGLALVGIGVGASYIAGKSLYQDIQVAGAAYDDKYHADSQKYETGQRPVAAKHPVVCTNLNTSVPQKYDDHAKPMKSKKVSVHANVPSGGKILALSQSMYKGEKKSIPRDYTDWLDRLGIPVTAEAQIMVQNDKDSHALRPKVMYNTSFIALATPEDKVFKFIGCLTFVHGSTAIMPKHYLRAIRKDSWEIDDDGTIKTVPGGRVIVFRAFSEAMIVADTTCPQDALIIEHPDVGVDLCSVTFREHFACKSLLKNFMEEKDLSLFNKIPAVLTTLAIRDVGGSHKMFYREYATARAVANDQPVGYSDGPNFIVMRNSYSYDVCTNEGDCGSLLVAIEPRMPRKILSMHVSGTGTCGYGVLLTRKIVESLIPPVAQQMNLGWLPTVDIGHFDSGEIVDPMAHYVRFVDENGVELIGSSCPYQGACQTIGKGIYFSKKKQVSLIEPSVLQTAGHVPYAPKKEPAVLNDYDSDKGRVNVRVEAFAKLSGPAINVPLRQIRDVFKDVMKDLYTDIDWYEYAVNLSVEEAIFGKPEWNINSVNMNASCGKRCELWGLNTHGKHGLIDLDKRWVHPKLLSAIDDQWEEWSKLTRSFDVFSAELKSELRTIPKHLKPRMYNSGDLVTLINTKRLFGGLTALMHKRWLSLGVTVGIDVHTQFSDLMNKLIFKALNGFDGDFEKFDGRLPACFIEGALFEFIMFYERAKEHLRQRFEDHFNRRVVAGHVIRLAFVLLDGFVVAFFKSNPSGNFLTTEINSVCVKGGGRLCWLEIYKGTKHATMGVYNSSVFEVANGDDNIFAVQDPFLRGADRPSFDQVSVAKAFSKFGMIYTDAEKLGVPIPSKPIKDCSFLKRRWRSVDDKFGCLDMDSILEIPLWYKKGPSSYENFSASMNSCLLELFYYGEETYEKYVSLYEKCLYGTEFSSWRFCSYKVASNLKQLGFDVNFVY